MVAIISWIFTALTSFVFLMSLSFKFDKTALEPAHIFSTVGAWLTDIIGPMAGDLFAMVGQYVIGGAELFASLILLSAAIFYKKRATLHFWGATLAVALMTGALFFHLVTPLGWAPTWSVAGPAECQALYLEATKQCSDTGLANMAAAIFGLGIVVMFLNRKSVR